MSDIVERLRDKHCCDDTCYCDEAAAEIERLRAALKRAAKELELLYFFAISNGIAESGIPPHVEARAALTAQPAAPGGDA